MQLTTVKIEKPDDTNFILGQTHFLKSVEDIHEALVGAVPGIKFGLAFCEASGKCLVRWSGTDTAMTELAKKNAAAIAAGHSFLVFLGDGFYPAPFYRHFAGSFVLSSTQAARRDDASLLPQEEVHHPAPPCMVPWLAAVVQDVGVVAACVFESIGQDRHIGEAAGIVDGLGCRHHCTGVPGQPSTQ